MSILAKIRRRISGVHPDHHAIAHSMAWVTLFVLLAALARAATELAIAYRYGVTAEVDAYLFVLNLVSWPVAVWFSVLTVVLVPLVAEIRQGGAADLPRFRAELLGLALILATGLALLLWIGLPFLLQSPLTGLPPATANLAIQMVPVLALLAPLRTLTCLFSSWMLAAGRHANSLLESIPSIVLLLTLLAFASGGVGPLMWGTFAGFALHLIGSIVLLVRNNEVEAPRITRHSKHWPVFWNGFGIMLIGQALMSFTLIIDQFFAAHLGTGAIATLSYANRLLALILGMGALVVSRGTLPVFSRAQAQGRMQLQLTAFYWACLLFVLGVIVMIVSWWLAPWGVALLFERGAFTAADTKAVAAVLQYGLPQLPFYFAGLVLVSLLVSQRKYHVVTVIGAINLVTKIIANAFLVPYFGIGGLMISTSIMLGLSCLCLSVAVYKNY